MHAREIAAIDAAHIWHPYAEPGQFTYPVESAAGPRITFLDGRVLIDAMSSWWACLLYTSPSPRDS